MTNQQGKKKIEKTIEDTTHIKQRTSSQNRALWKGLTLLANKMNEMGLDVRKVLKPTYEIWWTKEMIHDHLWMPFQKIKFGTNSTVFLEKHGQIEEIWDDLFRNLGEKFHIEYIDFPNDPKKQHEKNNYSSYEPADEIIDYPTEDLGGETPF
jgi:hypothetical protein